MLSHRRMDRLTATRTIAFRVSRELFCESSVTALLFIQIFMFFSFIPETWIEH